MERAMFDELYEQFAECDDDTTCKIILDNDSPEGQELTVTDVHFDNSTSCIVIKVIA